MKKAILIYIPLFIIISIGGGVIYSITDASNQETAVYDQDETYPSALRPELPSKDEEDDPIPDVDEELVSDENFLDFEIDEIKKTDEKNSETNVSEKQEDLQDVEQTKETEEAVAPTPSADQTVEGDEVEILPEKVNARVQPESGAKIVAVFEQGQRGVLIEEGESWSVIKIGDYQGYVNNKFWKKI